MSYGKYTLILSTDKGLSIGLVEYDFTLSGFPTNLIFAGSKIEHAEFLSDNRLYIRISDDINEPNNIILKQTFQPRTVGVSGSSPPYFLVIDGNISANRQYQLPGQAITTAWQGTTNVKPLVQTFATDSYGQEYKGHSTFSVNKNLAYNKDELFPSGIGYNINYNFQLNQVYLNENPQAIDENGNVIGGLTYIETSLPRLRVANISLVYFPKTPTINSFNITPVFGYKPLECTFIPSGSSKFVDFSEGSVNNEVKWFYKKNNSSTWVLFENKNTQFNYTFASEGQYQIKVQAISDGDVFEKVYGGIVTVELLPDFDFDIIVNPNQAFYSLDSNVDLSIQVKNNFPVTKLSQVKWNNSTLLNFNETFELTLSQLKTYTITASLTDLHRNHTIIKSVNLKVKHLESKYKKIYITVPPEQKMLIKKTNGGTYSDLDFQTELYNSIVDGKQDNSLFFAPRTWNEAGQIVDVEKTTRNGVPCVAITIEKRIGTYQIGMEKFSKADLPFNPQDIAENGNVNPRGCIFTTLDKTNNKAISLGTVNDYIFKDYILNYNIKKEGLEKNPIVIFAQNKTKTNFNVFGGLCQYSNLSFEQYPFQPYLCLLREDLISTETSKAFYCTSYTNSNIKKINYRPESFFSITPFDSKSLRFRTHQDFETDSGSYWGRPETLSWDENGVELKDFSSFLYKGARSFTGTPINTTGEPPLLYEETGILYSRKNGLSYEPVSGASNIYYDSTTLAYDDFYGAPYYYGSEIKSERPERLGFFDSLNNISYNVGDKNLDNNLTLKNQTSLMDFEIFGQINSSIIGKVSKQKLNSNFLSKAETRQLTPLNVENRYIAYSINNKIYMWDQFSNSDLGPYSIKNVTENFINLIGVRDFKFTYKVNDSNSITINSSNGTISNIPLSPKYFNGIDLFINLHQNKSKNIWDISTSKVGNNQGEQDYANSRTIKLNDSVTFKKDTSGQNIDNEVLISLYENSLYFSTNKFFGITNVGKNSYVYKLDETSGNVIENNYGLYRYNLESEVLFESRDSILLELNKENEKQNITIAGEKNGIAFLSSSSIILADKVKPYFNYSTNKIFTDSKDFINDMEIIFSTNEWTPDKINVCGTQLDSINEYKTFFNDKTITYHDLNTKSDGTNNKISLKCDLKEHWKNNGKYISGTHFITLGLENWPTGKEENGKRTNYEQSNLDSLVQNFSSPVVIVNHEDIVMDNNLNGNNVLETSLSVENTLTGTLPSVKGKYYFSKKDNYLEILGDFTPIEIPSIIGYEVSNINRYNGCTLLLEDKRIYKILKSTLNSIQILLPSSFIIEESNINDLISSFYNKKYAIGAFLPNKINYYDNNLNFGYELNLSIKNMSNNKVEFIPTTYIPNNNSVYVKLVEKFEDNYEKESSYTKNFIFDLTNSGSNLLTQVNLGFYRNYDLNTHVFTNDLISDRFNRFYPRYNLVNYGDYIYIKISASNFLDLDSPMKLVIKNKSSAIDEKIIYTHSGEENSITPIIINNISNKAGSKLLLVEVKTNKAPSDTLENSINSFLINNLNEIEVAFEAYDINGLKVRYGNSSLL